MARNYKINDHIKGILRLKNGDGEYYAKNVFVDKDGYLTLRPVAFRDKFGVWLYDVNNNLSNIEVFSSPSGFFYAGIRKNEDGTKDIVKIIPAIKDNLYKPAIMPILKDIKTNNVDFFKRGNYILIMLDEGLAINYYEVGVFGEVRNKTEHITNVKIKGIIDFKDRLVGFTPNESTIRFSGYRDPLKWTGSYELGEDNPEDPLLIDIHPEDDGVIVGLTQFMDRLIIFKNNGYIYQLIGTPPQIRVERLGWAEPILNHEAFFYYNKNLYFLTRNGIKSLQATFEYGDIKIEDVLPFEVSSFTGKAFPLHKIGIVLFEINKNTNEYLAVDLERKLFFTWQLPVRLLKVYRHPNKNQPNICLFYLNGKYMTGWFQYEGHNSFSTGSMAKSLGDIFEGYIEAKYEPTIEMVNIRKLIAVFYGENYREKTNIKIDNQTYDFSSNFDIILPYSLVEDFTDEATWTLPIIENLPYDKKFNERPIPKYIYPFGSLTIEDDDIIDEQRNIIHRQKHILHRTRVNNIRIELKNCLDKLQYIIMDVKTAGGI